MTSNGTSNYIRNTRNQLTGISGGTTASFLYDALGRRESKTISSTSTNFLYDGMNLEQELNGTTPTVNYLTGADIDETLSRTDSSGTESYLTDNLGSTMALTTNADAISTSYSYEPYGNTTASGTSSTNSLQYTGRENDGDGLYFYRARYYSPMFGRFTNEDPSGLLGGINFYAYSLGNPITYEDPTGLLTACEINWLNDNYGYFGGFLADTFNLQQIIPGNENFSWCSIGTAGELGALKFLVPEVFKRRDNWYLRLIGQTADRTFLVLGSGVTAFATAAVWQAQFECIDPITGRPQM